MPKKPAKILGVTFALIGILFFVLWFVTVGFDWIQDRILYGRPVYEKHASFGISIPAQYSINGIDVSHHQGKIDWKQVATMRSNGKQISFVFIKATEGISRQDRHFDRNWKGAKNNKLIRGAYHFYYPSRDPVKQAQNFIENVTLSPGDLPPVCDIEKTNGRSRKQIQEDLKVFLKELENQYKKKPIIYTGADYYEKYLSGAFDEYPLWLAYYANEEKLIENYNHEWHFWQHSESGFVDGITGKVDFNVFKGGTNQLKRLCLQ